MSQSLSNQYVSSLSVDFRLTPYDIQGSLAHVKMLGKKKILPPSAVTKIIRGLNTILRDFDKGRLKLKGEDIHFAIEAELIKRVGEAGKMMHTARSRNDQVVTDLYMYLRHQTDLVLKDIKDFQKSVLQVAQANRAIVMPGFTHLQHAQPLLFSHHILAYAWMLERDKLRFVDLLKRLSVLPLGSAALAGTSFPIDRHFVARQLGFKQISQNSIDATASRDVAVEFLAAAALVMTHLSRFAEELIIWSSEEFSYVKLAKAYTTGSSIMPQKRNPDMAELVRGKTGRVFGSLVSLLTMMKGTPLAYNRDLQEDKAPLFDAVDTLRGSLLIMSPMVKTMKVNRTKMKAQLETGFLTATEAADYLARKGVPFRTAHGVVQNVVRYCEKRKKRLDQLSLKELKSFDGHFEKNVMGLLKPEKVVLSKTSPGGTSPSSVKKQIQQLRGLVR